MTEKTARWFGTGSEKYRLHLKLDFKERESSEKQRIVITPREIWPGSAGSAC